MIDYEPLIKIGIEKVGLPRQEILELIVEAEESFIIDNPRENGMGIERAKSNYIEARLFEWYFKRINLTNRQRKYEDYYASNW